MLTAIVFLLILSILVLVHEFGHFIVGKLAGIGVLEFALGLPFTKPLWSKKLKNGMRLSLYPVLFGGFVKLLGEEGTADNPDKVKGIQFFMAPVWHRIAVVVAGVVMNLVLAVAVFYVFLMASGFKVVLPKIVDYQFLSPSQTVIVITQVVKDSPAQTAGIKFQDVVLSVNGQTFQNKDQFRSFIAAHGGEQVDLKLTDLDGRSTHDAMVTPRLNPPKDQGALGVGIDEGELIAFNSASQKAFSGLTYGADMFIYNIKILSFLVESSFKTHNAAPVTDNLSGPVGIYNNVNDILNLPTFKQVITTLINFLGVLSLSLAFMNILPIPAMDGGRLFFLLIEAISGKKMPAKLESLVNQVGLFLLLGLIIWISFNDVKKRWAPPCNKSAQVVVNLGLCSIEAK